MRTTMYTNCYNALLVAAYIASVGTVSGAPSAVNLKGDLALLVQNDLDWSPGAAPKPSSLLVAKAFLHTDAFRACQALNETLLSVPVPPEVDFKTHNQFLNNLMSIMKHLGLYSRFRKTMFWIDTEDNQGCSVISTNNNMQSVACDSQVPVFCSNSAPKGGKFDVEDERFHVEVKSKETTYIGNRDVLSFRFLGIPYADPTPRFSYSKVVSEASVEEAKTKRVLSSKPGCPTEGSLSSTTSEDCLYLDVFTPYLPMNPAKSKTMKPVLVWFGGNDSKRHDPGNLVSRTDVVVVRVNSRSGSLGYLALNDGIINGNFGLGDQIVALEWIREHIADFGGDASLVTIQGDFTTISSLFASRKSHGLYINAISHGGPNADIIYPSIANSYTSFGASFTKSVGCAGKSQGAETALDVSECLIKAPIEELLKAAASLKESSRIVQDGTYITREALSYDQADALPRVHVMFGWENDGAESLTAEATTTGHADADRVTVTTISEDDDEVTIETIVDGDQLDLGFAAGQQVLQDYNFTSSSSGAPSSSSSPSACINQISALNSAKYDVFPSVWAFSYPARLKDALFGALPVSDSSQARERQQMLIFSQIVADAIGAFARVSNPNPSPFYASARGYNYDGAEVDEWQPLKTSTVDEGKDWAAPASRPMRIFDVSVKNGVFGEDCGLSRSSTK